MDVPNTNGVLCRIETKIENTQIILHFTFYGVIRRINHIACDLRAANKNVLMHTTGFDVVRPRGDKLVFTRHTDVCFSLNAMNRTRK